MSDAVRRAGSGLLADGSRLTWTVADGRRGRRWRAVASRDGVISHGLLLEVDLDGRPSRLELTTTAGLLTLHPDGERRRLHGNAVLADGVRHLSLPWSDAHGLEVEGRPIATAVSAHRLARTTAVGEEKSVPVVVIAADLVVTETERRFARLGEFEWRIEGPTASAGSTTLTIDERGIPAGLGDAREWPLELD